jgi:hypothetical protein
MGIRQAWSDVRELRRELAELTRPSSQEEEAGYKLAVLARRFSRRSKRVVDDKLNFSATLMRAGEVEAANRLLEEFERDIRTEEAALIECVNEVKVARSLKRDRISRLRLVRVMAVALLGACVMSFSALGIAVAGMFQDRATKDAVQNAVGKGARAALAEGGATAAKKRSRRTLLALQVAGARETLTHRQLETVRELAISGDDEQLTDYLLSVLPPTVAEKVSHALGVADRAIDSAASPIPEIPVDVDKPKKAAKKQSEEAAAEAEAEKDEAKEAEESDEQPAGDVDDSNDGSQKGDRDGEGDGSAGPEDPLPEDILGD